MCIVPVWGILLIIAGLLAVIVGVPLFVHWYKSRTFTFALYSHRNSRSNHVLDTSPKADVFEVKWYLTVLKLFSRVVSLVLGFCWAFWVMSAYAYATSLPLSQMDAGCAVLALQNEVFKFLNTIHYHTKETCTWISVNGTHTTHITRYLQEYDVNI